MRLINFLLVSFCVLGLASCSTLRNRENSSSSSSVPKDKNAGIASKIVTAAKPKTQQDKKTTKENSNPTLIPTEINGKWGYIDEMGQTVIKPRFDLVVDFSEGLAAVEKGNKWGYIDLNGKQVVSFQFERASDFSEGMAGVEKDGQQGYINQVGELVVPFQFQEVSAFSNGLAAVQKGDKWGYINQKGKVVVPIQYDLALPFHNGVASVLVGDKEGSIDESGELIAPEESTPQLLFNGIKGAIGGGSTKHHKSSSSSLGTGNPSAIVDSSGQAKPSDTGGSPNLDLSKLSPNG